MKLSTALIILFAFLFAVNLQSQTEYLPKKQCQAYRVEQPPVINGDFDGFAWQKGSWSGDFTQYQPYANRPPSQQTEFKVAFDDMNLYVAIRALDSAPDSIVSRMGRRDNDDGDMVLVVPQ